MNEIIVPKAEEKKVETAPVEKQPEPAKPAVKEEKPAEEKKPVKENLLAGIVEQKAAGKTYALYLDTDVVSALDKLAKQNKCSRSKALNSLLRNLLLEK